MSGQIRFRRIMGWQKRKQVIEKSKRGGLIVNAHRFVRLSLRIRPDDPSLG
jgi:hypothetical protein